MVLHHPSGIGFPAADTGRDPGPRPRAGRGPHRHRRRVRREGPQGALTAQRDRWEAFCEDRDLAPGQVALAWLLHRPGVLGPIIGPRTMEQLDSAIEAVDIALSEDDLAGLDEIFPGPGGPAPEAYAW
ncbi:aldo/keto reductase [Brachybacterium paraconglomeratum]|uniref:aldo/keto reductase n=1 Tax=Brachybacterium paraconglomeratum TaxID=173362 RepID=UPI002882F2E4|nr:aldo/keto reductase [Brachybacterium paraconglomeratum]